MRCRCQAKDFASQKTLKKKEKEEGFVNMCLKNEMNVQTVNTIRIDAVSFIFELFYFFDDEKCLFLNF